MVLPHSSVVNKAILRRLLPIRALREPISLHCPGLRQRKVQASSQLSLLPPSLAVPNLFARLPAWIRQDLFQLLIASLAATPWTGPWLTQLLRVLATP